MNKSLLEYIKCLTGRDTKTLSQKALKASEEVGELAKVVLPFDNAFATNHRFVDKKSILEECVDTYLVVQSIAYELGFDDDDFEEMVKAKTVVWDELQNREEKYSDKVPFEAHVTVRTNDIEGFKMACRALEVKPIVLDLQDRAGGSVMTDVMTSHTFMGKNYEAFNEMKRVSEGLVMQGFDVIREKIETVPWHPAAPSRTHGNPVMPKHCYFENHFGIICNDAIRGKLLELADRQDCHLSQNIFKKVDEHNYKIMMTYRSYEGVYEEFRNSVSVIQEDLEKSGFEIDKVIVEFSIYDTKVSHDSSWIESK